jgi:hypothetical protein
MMENWRQFAACRGKNPGLFVVGARGLTNKAGYNDMSIEQQEYAFTFCDRCVVKPACKALVEKYQEKGAVYGGEYRPFNRRRRTKVVDRPSGDLIKLQQSTEGGEQMGIAEKQKAEARVVLADGSHVNYFTSKASAEAYAKDANERAVAMGIEARYSAADLEEVDA